jgi:ribosomal protein S18 acetylase RimI-like enzyme
LISASKLSFVAIKSDTVCGFIISGDNFSDAMKDWQKNNAFSITFFSLSKPRIFILKVFYFIKSIVKMLFRTNVNFKNKVPYRLFSIAVLSDSQSFGIGSKMISYLEECLLNMNIHEYGLSVKKSDKRAVKFYKRNSFSYEKTIQDNDFFIKSLIK